ncbi:hypothetical protein [Paeniglutamicibacter cryotolerans]|uniref:DUF5134 domain-containing protein n=1 Tax=Paeniglutamicibacter cryotolerans TaxID=670079 RepID=A0A839QIT6_9MICC|nr:hypothetical protein [Paeniglutamicibacter cryotolerans]MBB2995760.1 hypothetical protein [Paeniglutamicibacter cryotolerans]
MTTAHALLAEGMLVFTGLGTACCWWAEKVRTLGGLRDRIVLLGRGRRSFPKPALPTRATWWMVLMTLAMADLAQGEGGAVPGVLWGLILILAAPVSIGLERMLNGAQLRDGMALHRSLCMIAMGVCMLFLHCGPVAPQPASHHGGAGTAMVIPVLVVLGAYAAYSLRCGIQLAHGARRDSRGYAQGGEMACGAVALLCMLAMSGH